MTAKIINGKQIADELLDSLKAKVDKQMRLGKRPPGLAVIQVGQNPASSVYVRNKVAACKKIGLRSFGDGALSEDITEQQLLSLIDDFNKNEQIDGILVQLPLPSSINADVILERIDPAKDVDGFHPYNMGRLAQKRPLLRPCTPKGVMTLLATTGEDLRGKHAVVVGASNIVGRPMGLELLMAACTVTTCHSQTKNLQQHIEQADIVVVAVGRPGIVNSNWIKQGAIVIDVGINRINNKLIGDIEFDTAKDKAAWITPVPGGVGPMTVATLLQNTVEAAYSLK